MQVRRNYRQLINEFYERTHDLKISSDLFRILRIDRSIKDKQHGIGAFFRWLIEQGYLEHIGYVRSTYGNNHGRRIGQYLWTLKAEAELR